MPMNNPTQCPSCGARLSPEDGRYCPVCGIDIDSRAPQNTESTATSGKASNTASVAIKTGGTVTDVIGRLLWIGVLLAAALALFNYVTTRMATSEISAPQLAALAAESLAIAVLPYVLARAWDEVCRPPRWR